MNKQELKKREREIEAVARKHGVISIKVFGSVARGQANSDSDVDFLVELEPGRSLLDLGGLQSELETILGCKVDVVTPHGLRKRLRSRVSEEAVAI